MNKIAAVDIGTIFGSKFTGDPTKPGSTIGEVVSLGINLAFVLAGILILFMLVFAGFKMVQGAGNSDPKSAEQAKQAATSAVIGFAIIFTSFWIIKLIEVIIGVDFITTPGF